MSTAAYTAVFEHFRDGSAESYQVHFPALPEIITWGPTLAAAKANAQEALEFVLESMRGGHLSV